MIISALGHVILRAAFRFLTPKPDISALVLPKCRRRCRICPSGDPQMSLKHQRPLWQRGIPVFCKTSSEGIIQLLSLFRHAYHPFRAQRRPWVPSFSLAVRLLFLVRISGAMYSNISDCDEGPSTLDSLSWYSYHLNHSV